MTVSSKETCGYSCPVSRRDAVSAAVYKAICAGYTIGREVRIGIVDGIIVGYNIGNFGKFCAIECPILVQTSYGLIKCASSELTLV